MHRRIASALIVIITLTGCSSDPSAGPTAPSPTGTSANSGEPASVVLKEAISKVVNEPSTRFRFETVLAHETAFEIEGVAFAFETRSWLATARFKDPRSNKPIVMHARSIGATSWMQMENWPTRSAGCWLRLAGRQVPIGIQGLIPGEPGYVSLISYLTSPAFTGSSRSAMTAELELSAASFLLQSQLFQHIELNQAQASSGSVQVAISLEGRRLTRIELAGADMLRAIENADGSVTSTSRTALENTTYRVDYLAPAPGTPATVTAPPKALVITDTDAEGCH